MLITATNASMFEHDGDESETTRHHISSSPNRVPARIIAFSSNKMHVRKKLNEYWRSRARKRVRFAFGFVCHVDDSYVGTGSGNVSQNIREGEHRASKTSERPKTNHRERRA